MTTPRRESRSKKAGLVTLLGLSLGTLGCQCCPTTERYQDMIDHIADHQPHMDRFYHPGLDLTRIGYPDWCQSRLNRCLYGDCNCRDTRQQPPYIHNPMYSPQAHSERMGPIPEQSPIAPLDNVGPSLQGTEPVPTQMKALPNPVDLEKGNQLPPLPPIRPESPAPQPMPPLAPPVK